MQRGCFAPLGEARGEAAPKGGTSEIGEGCLLRTRQHPFDDIGVLGTDNRPAAALGSQHIDPHSGSGRKRLTLRPHVTVQAPA